MSSIFNVLSLHWQPFAITLAVSCHGVGSVLPLGWQHLAIELAKLCLAHWQKQVIIFDYIYGIVLLLIVNVLKYKTAS